MSCIIIGDPHFQVTNIPEVNEFIDIIEKRIIEKNPDFIVVLGDVLHTHERIHSIPLNKAYEFFDKLRKITKTYILVGNHDMQSNQNFLEPNHWMNGLKEWDNIVIVDTVIYEHILGHDFVFCPYVPVGRFEEALNTCRSFDWKQSKCIFAHQEFYGCKMGAITSVLGDQWNENYPNVISGHIHSKQTLKNIYYCGSSMQIAFGESSENIIPYVTFNFSTNYDLEELNLHLPRKKIVYVDIDDIDKFTNKNNNKNDKIKLTVSGSYEEFKVLKKTQKYKELIQEGVKIAFKPTIVEKEYDTYGNNNNKLGSNTDFLTILHSLVEEKKDDDIHKMYALIFK